MPALEKRAIPRLRQSRVSLKILMPYAVAARRCLPSCVWSSNRRIGSRAFRPRVVPTSHYRSDLAARVLTSRQRALTRMRVVTSRSGRAAHATSYRRIRNCPSASLMLHTPARSKCPPNDGNPVEYLAYKPASEDAKARPLSQEAADVIAYIPSLRKRR